MPSPDPIPEESPDDSGDHVQAALDRFNRAVEEAEGHQRRTIDAAGWWVVRVILSVLFAVLLVAEQSGKAVACAGCFAATFIFSR